MRLALAVSGSLLTWSAAQGPVANAQEIPFEPPDHEVQYSPYLQENFPNQVFFGDTHLHTAFSAIGRRNLPKT
jgi:hypothetical protein